MCPHEPSGIIVYCYHDDSPMDLEQACTDCGMRAEHEPEHDWERKTYFIPMDAGRVQRVMAVYNIKHWAGTALYEE